MCDQDPGLCAFDGFLPISCRTTAAAKPREGALDNPSSRQHLEAFGGVGSFDDLQRPASEADKGAPQLRPAIATIGEYVTHFRGLAAELGEDAGRTVQSSGI